MFMEEPTAGGIKRVAAFMYGNCVRVSDGVASYIAFSGRHQN